MDKDKDGSEVEPRQLTAIFRPDDAGERKERLRLSHEEQARLGMGSGVGIGTSSWERREDDDVKDEDDVEKDINDGTIGTGSKMGTRCGELRER